MRTTTLPAALAMAAGLLAAVPAAASAAPSIRAQSWYLDALHTDSAQQVATGKGITVAVLDKEFTDVPELSGRLLAGVDMLSGTSDATSGEHQTVNGTSVAALVAGAGGGPDRTLGVAPGATILPVRVPIHDMTQDRLVKAVHWAVDHGARVIVTAAGTGDEGSAFSDLVDYLTAHNAVLVAGAGGQPAMTAPATTPGVVAVTGIDRDGRAWSASATGQTAAVAAPAAEIPVPTGMVDPAYVTANGTVLAAGLVAGELALIMSKYHGISAVDAINRLVSTADDRGVKGRDTTYGYGVADPAAALAGPAPHVTANPLLAVATAAAATAGVSADATTGGMSTVLVIAVVVIVVLLLLVLVVVILTLRSRRRGDDGDGGGGGGGGPDGPPRPGPPGGPVGYQYPQMPQWLRPTSPPAPSQPKERQPVSAGRP